MPASCSSTNPRRRSPRMRPEGCSACCAVCATMAWRSSSCRHKLEEVLELCDAVTVLRDGQNVCPSQPMAGLDRVDLVRMMIGRAEAIVTPRRRAPDTPSLMELSARDHCRGSSRCRPGGAARARSSGLYGLVGAGRTELAHAIIGATPITGGTMRTAGAEGAARDPADALHRLRIGYVSEDRKGEGLVLMHAVRSNVAVTIWGRIAGRLAWVTSRHEDDAVRPLIDRLEVRTPDLEQPVGLLVRRQPAEGQRREVARCRCRPADRGRTYGGRRRADQSLSTRR